MPSFDRLQQATTEEYPTQLAEIVRGAYLPIFQIVDPSDDDDIKISDAFRQFGPSAQRQKMIGLFRALCEEAGIIPKRRRRASPSVANGPQKVKAHTPAKGREVSPAAQGQTGTAAFTANMDAATTALLAQLSHVDPAILAVLRHIPSQEKGWAPAEKERFSDLFSKILDVAIPLREEGRISEEQEAQTTT